MGVVMERCGCGDGKVWMVMGRCGCGDGKVWVW